MTTDDLDGTEKVLVVTTQVVCMSKEDQDLMTQDVGQTTEVLFQNNQARFHRSQCVGVPSAARELLAPWRYLSVFALGLET